MLAIGLMMVGLTHMFGHSYIDGVGYSLIQQILDHKMTAAGLLALLFALKLIATTVSLGCGASGRREATLVNETIYTVKLRHRGHRIPKERHINLYLVKQAQDIMERRFIVARAGTTLKQAMAAEDTDDARAIVVEREGRIVGLIPPRSGLWVESQTNPDLLVESFAEGRMVICRDQDLLSLVFARLKRHRAGAAIVFRGGFRPRVSDIVGIVTKRVIADAVIDSYED
jgi:CIC family chloride channel protein